MCFERELESEVGVDEPTKSVYLAIEEAGKEAKILLSPAEARKLAKDLIDMADRVDDNLFG